MISNLVKLFVEDQKDPKELLHQCILRSRDRFDREYAKLNSFYVQQNFFTEEGVKGRQQSLKFKMMMKEKYPDKVSKDSDIKNLGTYEKALNMLILHNQKVDRIQ